MKELKVGDLVRVKYASIDEDLIGKVLPITKVEGNRIWVEGSVSCWIDGSGSLEKIEPQYLKKGTRVKILVDREDIMFNSKITCHTGVIEAEGPELYGVCADNGNYYGVKHSNVEEIREEELEYKGIPIQVNSLVPPDTMYCWNENSQVQFFIKNSPKKGGKKSIMSGLKKATNFIRSLKQPLKNYVRLGWVELYEDEYVVTDEGMAYYMDVVFGLTSAKTLEEYAEKEVARIKKEEEK